MPDPTFFRRAGPFSSEHLAAHVDRGALGDTRIGTGYELDNGVQSAHNAHGVSAQAPSIGCSDSSYRETWATYSYASAPA